MSKSKRRCKHGKVQSGERKGRCRLHAVKRHRRHRQPKARKGFLYAGVAAVALLVATRGGQNLPGGQ